MPTVNPLAALFGQSPIKPLQGHMQSVIECAQCLQPFIEAVIADDWNKAEEEYERIVSLENRADAEKKQIRLHLPKSLFMPIPRQDLLNLLSKQDKIANISKDIAGLMLGRKMSVHPTVAGPFIIFIQEAIAAALAAKSMIDELDELIETGFGGREIDLIEQLIIKLDELEHQTDEKQILIRSTFHSLENQLPPVDVVFIYKIIEWIGNLADCAQTIGEQIQIIVAR